MSNPELSSFPTAMPKRQVMALSGLAVGVCAVFAVVALAATGSLLGHSTKKPTTGRVTSVGSATETEATRDPGDDTGAGSGASPSPAADAAASPAAAGTAAPGAAGTTTTTTTTKAPAAAPAAPKAPAPAPAPAPSGNITVKTAAELTAALAAVKPGNVITLANGTYAGNFTAKTAGTAAAPIRLVGGRGAVLSGGSAGYTFYLNGSSYWALDGFTIKGGKKGIVSDAASHFTINNIDLSGTGEEGIRIRSCSTDNTVSNSSIHNIGIATPGFGEGIYLGTANGSWGTQSTCGLDRSDRTQVINNTISQTGAESIDVKEGTTGGTIRGNHFDGTGMSGDNFADSWMDMKGNNYTIDSNVGVHARLDGFQVHQDAGFGNNNTFVNNNANVGASGYGFNIDTATSGNIVRCNNVVTGAGKGQTNLTCKP